MLIITGGFNTSFGFDLQGHRGARGLMPENTLPAFAKALSVGVSTLELDLAVTIDGRVVVSHNPRLVPALSRDKDGTWLEESSPPIHLMTLEEVQSYDVGRLNPTSSYARRLSGQQPVDHTPIPTLGEVIELVKRSGNQQIRLNIEIKTNPEKPDLTLGLFDFAQTVVNVIRKYNWQSRVTVQSFDWRALAAVQALEPAITTSYLTVNQPWLNNLQSGRAGASPWLNGFDIDRFGGSVPRAIVAAGGDVWSPYHREISVESIKEAHQLGLLVKVWTVNQPERMRALIDMGADGIITDYPGRLRQVLKALDERLPMATPVE